LYCNAAGSSHGKKISSPPVGSPHPSDVWKPAGASHSARRPRLLARRSAAGKQPGRAANPVEAFLVSKHCSGQASWLVAEKELCFLGCGLTAALCVAPLRQESA